jgi:hypothetical protein
LGTQKLKDDLIEEIRLWKVLLKKELLRTLENKTGGD